MPTTGHTNTLVDVPGFRVGHHTRREPGWLTGTTVVVPPPGGAVAGVDVRGGAPGTRETDLLDPRNLVDRADAVVLTGGSAFGLAAADGVMRSLYADGLGWPMGAPGQVVPIVPAAVLFDLGRGGVFDAAPTAADGAAAYAAATADAVGQGVVGAGTGAQVGGLKGGIGSASVILADGTTVAALVVVNAVGSTVDAQTGVPLALRHGIDGEFDGVPVPDPGRARTVRDAAAVAEAAARTALRAGTATTIGVIATDATLTKAQCQKTAGLGHDGLARACAPVHTLFDGDTLFVLASGQRPAPELPGLHDLMVAASECVTRAVGHAVLAAESVDARGSGGQAFPSWRAAYVD